MPLKLANIMHLYGVTESDVAYILDTFPIVRDQDTTTFGGYRTKEDVLAQWRRIQQGALAL